MDQAERTALTRIEQLSAAWFAARVGRVTASNVAKAMSILTRASKGKQKGESSAVRDRYMIDVMVEILTGQPIEHYVSPAMDDGRETEKLACAEYSFVTGDDLERTGLWVHPKIDRFSASPDRLIDDDGIFEVKCPLPQTHIAYLMAGVCPADYFDQVQAEIACSDRAYGVFASFCKAMPKELRLFRVQVPRDEARIAEMEERVLEFLEEMAQKMSSLGTNAVPYPLREKLRESIAALTEHQAYTEAAEFVDRFEMTP